MLEKKSEEEGTVANRRTTNKGPTKAQQRQASKQIKEYIPKV